MANHERLDNPDDGAPLQDWLGAAEAGSEGLPSWLNAELPEFLAPAAPVAAPVAAPPPLPAPPAVVAAAPLPAPRGTPPALRIAILKPTEAEVHQAVRFVIQLRNDDKRPVQQVCVQFHPSPGWLCGQTVPINLQLGTLAPRAKRQVKLKAIPTIAGMQTIDYTLTTAAGVCASGQMAVPVSDLPLGVRITNAEAWEVGQERACSITVANPGTGPVAGIRLTANVPEGLAFAASDGGHHDPEQCSVSWPLTDLAAGEARTVTLRLRGVAPGDGCLRAVVQAEGRPPVEAGTSLHVALPAAASAHVLDELIAGIDDEVEQQLRSRHQPAQAVRASEEATHQRFVIFSLAGTDYAVPLGNVVEIGDVPHITAVPNVPAWALGVANVRGDIVSIVNLRSFFGLEQHEGASTRRVVLVRSLQEDLTAGLVVDLVRGIRPVPAAELKLPSAGAAHRLGDWVSGVGQLEARLLVVLDLERLLLSPQMRV